MARPLCSYSPTLKSCLFTSATLLSGNWDLNLTTGVSKLYAPYQQLLGRLCWAGDALPAPLLRAHDGTRDVLLDWSGDSCRVVQ